MNGHSKLWGSAVKTGRQGLLCLIMDPKDSHSGPKQERNTALMLVGLELDFKYSSLLEHTYFPPLSIRIKSCELLGSGDSAQISTVFRLCRTETSHLCLRFVNSMKHYSHY